MRTLIATAIFILSCLFSISFSFFDSQPQSLRQLLIQFKKNPGDLQNKEELVQFYTEQRKAHEEKLMLLSKEEGMAHWDKLVNELNDMQAEFRLISTSAEATELLNPVDYSYSLNSTKELAAASCYQRGLDLMKGTGTKSYSNRIAALAFRKANEFVPGYRDALKMAGKVSKNGRVNVLITGLQFDSGYYKGGIYYGSESRFQDVLSEKLNQKTGGGAARFFTQEQALEQNETMDWVVYLNWSDLASRPTASKQGSYNESQRIQTGTDAKGIPVFETRNATITVFQRTITTTGNLVFSIRDVHNNEEIAAGSIHTENEGSESSVDFTGDAGGLNNYAKQTLQTGKERSISTPSPDAGVTSLNREIFDPLKYKILTAIGF